MPGKTKSKAAGITPQPQQIMYPQVQTDEAGRYDLGAYINQLSQQPGPSMPALYDPTASRQVPNPAYAGSGGQTGAPADLASLMSLIGGSDWQSPGQQPTGAPYAQPDLRQMIEQPSDQSQVESNTRSKQQVSPGPLADRIAELKAHGAYLDKLTKALQANPAVQYQLPEYLPYPTRTQADIPMRAAPRLDPLAGGLATLAGLIDPQHAGQYGSQPLQAGIAQAQQETEDRQRRYEQVTRQLTEQYQDSLAARNDRAHYNSEQAGANFTNANASREAALKLGDLGAQNAGNTSLSDILGGINQQSKDAAGFGMEADLARERIAAGLAGNANAVKLYQDQNKSDYERLKVILPLLANSNKSDDRLQGLQERIHQMGLNAETRAASAKAVQDLKNESAKAIQTMRDTDYAKRLDWLEHRQVMIGAQQNSHDLMHNAGILAVAKVRADTIMQRYQNAMRIPNVPPDLRIMMQAQSNAYNTAYRVAAQAGLDPETDANTQHALAALNNAAQRAEQYRQQNTPQQGIFPGTPAQQAPQRGAQRPPALRGSGWTLTPK